MADPIAFTGSVTAGIQAAVVSAPNPQPVADRSAKGTAPSADKDVARPVAPALSLDRAVQEVQAHVQASSSELRFMVDKETNRPYVKVVDHATGEVILQIPSEEVLTAARKLRELAHAQSSAGLLVDQRG